MNTEITRRQMVEQQVRTWDVFDPDVLTTIGAVPRERFVPAEMAHCAYADIEVPLAHGQCMLRPSLAGKILQAVDIQAGDRVLEIGTGTGYLTQCISLLAAAVTSIDIYEEFIAAARSRLADQGTQNVDLQCMDATLEVPAGPYDVIIVTASGARIDQHFLDVMAPGGRLFMVVGERPVMTATLVTRQEGDELTYASLFETDIPPLVTTARPAKFSF